MWELNSNFARSLKTCQAIFKLWTSLRPSVMKFDGIFQHQSNWCNFYSYLNEAWKMATSNELLQSRLGNLSGSVFIFLQIFWYLVKLHTQYSIPRTNSVLFVINLPKILFKSYPMCLEWVRKSLNVDVTVSHYWRMCGV